MELFEFSSNCAHSNGRVGLKITGEMAARTYPCKPTKNERFKAPIVDMFAENPSILMQFTDFVTFKNH